MKVTQFITAAFAATVAAGPMAKRDSDIAREAIAKRQGGLTDVQVLNFALTLEHLEAAFYQQALRNYTRQAFIAAGYADPYYENVVRLRNQEVAHVNFLTAALQGAGAEPVRACTRYAFPSNSVASYAAVSQILEGVGVSAYSGAAAAIANDDFLTAAATILGVEARHSSYIRDKNRKSPFPAVFEIPLNVNQIFSLAAPFLAQCPPGGDLPPLTQFPALALSPSQRQPIRVGDTITLVTAKPTYADVRFVCWPLVAGPVCQPATRKSSTTFTSVVPRGGVTGQGYAILSSAGAAGFSDDTTIAGPAVVEVLPPVVV